MKTADQTYLYAAGVPTIYTAKDVVYHQTQGTDEPVLTFASALQALMRV